MLQIAISTSSVLSVPIRKYIKYTSVSHRLMPGVIQVDLGVEYFPVFIKQLCFGNKPDKVLVLVYHRKIPALSDVKFFHYNMHILVFIDHIRRFLHQFPDRHIVELIGLKKQLPDIVQLNDAYEFVMGIHHSENVSVIFFDHINEVSEGLIDMNARVFLLQHL